MQTLSITTAWNETAEFARRNFGALFTVALAFNALPSVALQALAPAAAASAAPGQAGIALLLMPVVIILTLVGTLAISALALARENVVGSAIGYAFRRFLPLLGATMLIALAAVAVAIPLVLAAGLTPETLSTANLEAMRRLSLVFLVMMAVFVFIWVRLMLMTPVAAAESHGPIGLIRRSWQLTKGRFWKLLGFMLLLIVVLLVVSLVVAMVTGIIITLVAGRPEPGNLAYLLTLLVGGLVNAAFIALFTTMVARIYAQLAGSGAQPGRTAVPPTSGT